MPSEYIVLPEVVFTGVSVNGGGGAPWSFPLGGGLHPVRPVAGGGGRGGEPPRQDKGYTPG